MKVDKETLAKVKKAFEEYEAEVNDAPLSGRSKATYTLYPSMFIRWLEDDFEPGVNNEKILERYGR